MTTITNPHHALDAAIMSAIRSGATTTERIARGAVTFVAQRAVTAAGEGDAADLIAARMEALRAAGTITLDNATDTWAVA